MEPPAATVVEIEAARAKWHASQEAKKAVRAAKGIEDAVAEKFPDYGMPSYTIHS